jgi:hypothetical protein
MADGAYDGTRYRNVINTDLINQRIEETTVGTITTTYVGFATPNTPTNSGTWLIKKIIEDSADGSTVITFAGNSTNDDQRGKFDKKWTAKGTYNYDR